MVTAAEGDRPVRAASALACNWLAGAGSGTWCRSCRLDTSPGRGQGSLEHRSFQQAKRRVVRQLHRFGVDPSRGRPAAALRARPLRGRAPGHDRPRRRPRHPRCRRGRPRRPRGGQGVARRAVPHRRSATCATRPATGTGQRWWPPTTSASPGSANGSATSGWTTPTALEAHYEKVDDGTWMAEHISHYASAHPWEDYAESFAQVLHLSDTLETARAFGLSGEPAQDFEGIHAAVGDARGGPERAQPVHGSGRSRSVRAAAGRPSRRSPSPTSASRVEERLPMGRG